MNKLKLVFLMLLFFSCMNGNQDVLQTYQMDNEANLKGIENTRQKFMQVVKDKDGETIGKLVTKVV